jgi:hypothetical protein
LRDSLSNISSVSVIVLGFADPNSAEKVDFRSPSTQLLNLSSTPRHATSSTTAERLTVGAWYLEIQSCFCRIRFPPGPDANLDAKSTMAPRLRDGSTRVKTLLGMCLTSWKLQISRSSNSFPFHLLDCVGLFDPADGSTHADAATTLHAQLLDSAAITTDSNGSSTNAAHHIDVKALDRHIELALSACSLALDAEDRMRLDASGTKLWNTCTRLLRNQDGDKEPSHGLSILIAALPRWLAWSWLTYYEVRVFAFFMLECGTRTGGREDDAGEKPRKGLELPLRSPTNASCRPNSTSESCLEDVENVHRLVNPLGGRPSKIPGLDCL